MVDLSLDLNKLSPTYLDLLIVEGDLVLTADAETGGTNNVQQDILQRLRFGLGEWFLDNSQGFPWVQQVFVKAPDLGKIDALIQNTILGTPGVISLNSYSSEVNLAGRSLILNFTAMTTAGKVDYSGPISPTGGG
jgi:hypothetical protein